MMKSLDRLIDHFKWAVGFCLKTSKVLWFVYLTIVKPYIDAKNNDAGRKPRGFNIVYIQYCVSQSSSRSLWKRLQIHTKT